ncbi:phage virion morphogenesis protein [Sphingopyxis yananensis]|uniref:phage virion morphogenesis protein n=1 Tax=Sphingopyxis yananensis TaxID=2886687 RepID=UPI001D1059E7|nr:phage virion morphogenesis protein [Sphingopyxis yananensis]MCC2602534.1 phage virion morphogenesis protein [Sphingopyxis yananensis]
MADDFRRLEPWLQEIASRFDDRSRLKMGRRIAQALRKMNAKRIAANTQPDGTAMDPRKQTEGAVRKKVRASGKMFKRLRLAKNMPIRVHPEQVEISFDNQIAATAAVHHFGLRDRVSKFRGAPSIRYPRRELLGFGTEDEAAIMDIILETMEA